MYIYLNVCKWMNDVKLFLLHTNSWNHLTVCKQMWTQAHLKNIQYICINRIWYCITYNDWYTIKPNPTQPTFLYCQVVKYLKHDNLCKQVLVSVRFMQSLLVVLAFWALPSILSSVKCLNKLKYFRYHSFLFEK